MAKKFMINKKIPFFLCLPGDLDESLSPPDLDMSLSVSARLEAVRSVLECQRHATIMAFDMKDQYKVLSEVCGIVLTADCLDPKVAAWLLDPEAKERNLHGLVQNYLPFEAHLLECKYRITQSPNKLVFGS